MEQPPGMTDPQLPNHVWKLQQALYDKKQAPHAWFDPFSTFLLKYDFLCSFSDPSLYVFHCSSGSLIHLLYVDNMLLTGSNSQLFSSFIQLLLTEFAMKDLDPLHHFLGIKVTTTVDGLQLLISLCPYHS